MQSGIEVHGIFYIFDKLVEHKLITLSVASAALNFLSGHNNRLPKNEIEKRLELWKFK